MAEAVPVMVEANHKRTLPKSRIRLNRITIFARLRVGMKNATATTLFFWLATCLALAQADGESVHGQVTDPSGAAVANATVLMTPTIGSRLTAETNAEGIYEFKNLSTQKYTLAVISPGFATYQNDK